MRREAIVAGQFYPGEADELRRSVTDLLACDQSPRAVIGLMAPHAGYVFSGAIAGRTLSQVKLPSTIVLLGPNHTGFGAPLAVFPPGAWSTPLGDIRIDSSLAQKITNSCPDATFDDLAHRHEHSLEVLVPFIQVQSPQTAIVPICVGPLSLQELLDFGMCLGEILAPRLSDVLLIASSDMTHFESAEKARQRDMKALEKVLALDPEGLYKVVKGEEISMCGVLPMVAMLAAARELKAHRASLVQYGNSGDATGNQAEVVAYAGVIIE